MKTSSSPVPAHCRVGLLWKGALSALVLAAVATTLVPGCSTQKCKDLKGQGSVFGSVLCGGEGDDAPIASNPNQPNFCSDVRAVMPAFFALLERSDKPLAGLREAVKQLGQTQCLQSLAERKCDVGGVCELGECTNSLCPCARGFNPLSDLLVITFKALNIVSRDANETSTARCATTSVAATLPSTAINRMCEIRRLLDVLLQQNGGTKVLDDPAVTAVVVALLDYVQGKGYPAAHYDLFTTMGRMAANPGICAPATAYDLLDKLLGWLSPAHAVPVLDHLAVLLKDPTTQEFLKKVSSSDGSGSVTGRAAIVQLAKSLLPSLTAARTGEEAMAPITDLVKRLILLNANYPQTFKDKVQAVLDDVEVLLGPALGLWPPLKSTLICMNDPNVDPDGELIGAIYDLISLKEHLPVGVPGVDIATLLDALNKLANLDPTGQVARTAQLVVRSLSADEQGTEAVRQLLSELLTPEIGQRMIPSLSVMLQSKDVNGVSVIGEVLTLLDDLLYECKEPK